MDRSSCRWQRTFYGTPWRRYGFKHPPCTRQLLNLFEEVWESVVSIKRVPLDETPQYVIVEGEKDDRDKT